MFHTRNLCLLLSLLGFYACTKEPLAPRPAPVPPTVEMEYTDLGNYPIENGKPGLLLDVNKDGYHDLFFGIMLVGDPIYKVDKLKYQVVSSPYAMLAVNATEETPPLSKGTLIPATDFSGHNWFGALAIVLIERIEDVQGRKTWQGNWKNKTRQFLPFHYTIQNKRLTGWVEISADIAAEKLIMHRMAISKKTDQQVKAGE